MIIVYRYIDYGYETEVIRMYDTDDNLIGSVMIGGPPRGYIQSFFVDEKYRRQGCGTRMMKRLLARHGHKSLSLGASLDNPNKVIPFYQKYGFVITSTYPGTGTVDMIRDPNKVEDHNE